MAEQVMQVLELGAEGASAAQPQLAMALHVMLLLELGVVGEEGLPAAQPEPATAE